MSNPLKIEKGFVARLNNRFTIIVFLSNITFALKDIQINNKGNQSVKIIFSKFFFVTTKGYYKKIAKALHDKLAEEGFDFLYCFPIRRSTIDMFNKYIPWTVMNELQIMMLQKENYRRSVDLPDGSNCVIEKLDDPTIRLLSDFKYDEKEILPTRNFVHLKLIYFYFT